MYQIQMKQDSSWLPLGGRYDAETADERVLQFMNYFNTKKGSGRQFRVVQIDGHQPTGRFPTERTNRSPRVSPRRAA